MKDDREWRNRRSLALQQQLELYQEQKQVKRAFKYRPARHEHSDAAEQAGSVIAFNRTITNYLAYLQKLQQQMVQNEDTSIPNANVDQLNLNLQQDNRIPNAE